MLNQNITLILSTLLGGLLSALGGFLANYYVQKAAIATKKQDDARKILEELYADYLKLEKIYRHLFFVLIEENKIEIDTIEIDNIFHHMEPLIFLYAQSLAPVFLELRNQVDELVKSAVSFRMKKASNLEETASLQEKLSGQVEQLLKVAQKFLTTLLNLSKQKGYDYFK